MNTVIHHIFVIILILMAFLIGRCGNDDNKQTTDVQIVHDTVYIVKEYTTTWTPKNEAKKEYKEVVINDTLTIKDTVYVVKDSINVNGAGLKFEHLVRYNDILKSDYNVYCPEMRITTTIKETKQKKFGILLGAGAGYNYAQNKINYNLNAGIRIKKLSLTAGYNTDNQILINLNKEL